MGGCGEVWGDRGRSGHRRRRASLPTSASAAPTSSLRGKGGGRSTETRTRLRARRSPATTPALSVLFYASSLSSDRRAGKPPPRHRARRAHGRLLPLRRAALVCLTPSPLFFFPQAPPLFCGGPHAPLLWASTRLCFLFLQACPSSAAESGPPTARWRRSSSTRLPRLPEIPRDSPRLPVSPRLPSAPLGSLSASPRLPSAPLGSLRPPSAPSRPPLDLPSTSPRTTRQVVAFKGAPLAHAKPCVSKDIPARRRGPSRATSGDLG